MGRQDTNITGPDRQTGEMTFWGHLDVLRWGIIRVAAALAVCMALCFIAMPHIFDSLILGPASSDFFTYKWLSWMRGGSLLHPLQQPFESGGPVQGEVAGQLLYKGHLFPPQTGHGNGGVADVNGKQHLRRAERRRGPSSPA